MKMFKFDSICIDLLWFACFVLLMYLPTRQKIPLISKLKDAVARLLHDPPPSAHPQPPLQLHLQCVRKCHFPTSSTLDDVVCHACQPEKIWLWAIRIKSNSQLREEQCNVDLGSTIPILRNLQQDVSWRVPSLHEY